MKNTNGSSKKLCSALLRRFSSTLGIMGLEKVKKLVLTCVVVTN